MSQLSPSLEEQPCSDGVVQEGDSGPAALGVSGDKPCVAAENEMESVQEGSSSVKSKWNSEEGAEPFLSMIRETDNSSNTEKVNC